MRIGHQRQLDHAAPQFFQNRSYSRRRSWSVGCGDHSTPKCRRYSRPTTKRRNRIKSSVAQPTDQEAPGSARLPPSGVGASSPAQAELCPTGALLVINQPALSRDGDGLGSADRTHLFQNNLHVAFHCVLANVEDLTNFFITLAQSHLFENLKFPLGQLWQSHGVSQLRGDIMR